MNTGVHFTVFLIAIVGCFILIYNLRKRDRLRQRKELAEDWPKFLQAKERRDIQGVIEVGLLLFRNPLLEPKESRIIEAFIKENIKKYPDLKKLEEAEKSKASMSRQLTWFELFEIKKKK